ncbi:hypothetical protein [Acanthopleuribacter pedis]|uniref:Uncharacterized protein n=1 Tax=Acanthopleuribacter pedis TaxID=442870 RepID=A0A8J7Q480_9BACT|nr:hypothetical protein [Acanthopleuribacter pedis]MBO1317757.1 hypothetical protein [Acanthopleuribacter pedis]
MDAVSSALAGLDRSRALLDLTAQRLSEGYVLPEVVSAQSTAEVQLETQVSTLKEALAAEAQVLDLLA